MPAHTFTGLAVGIDFGVVVVSGTGYGSGSDGVITSRGRVGRRGVGGGGGVFVTESEDHDERCRVRVGVWVVVRGRDGV